MPDSREDARLALAAKAMQEAEEELFLRARLKAKECATARKLRDELVQLTGWTTIGKGCMLAPTAVVAAPASASVPIVAAPEPPAKAEPVEPSTAGVPAGAPTVDLTEQSRAQKRMANTWRSGRRRAAPSARGCTSEQHSAQAER